MSTHNIPDNLPEWIAEHLKQYLEDPDKGHYWDASWAGGKGPTPCLLLTTTGRRSGEPRVIPLIYGRTGDSYVIIASRGGAPSHPSWYLNIEADPHVKLQVASRHLEAVARVATGEERARLWEMMAALYPPYDDYQAKTDRQIPVVVLDPA